MRPVTRDEIVDYQSYGDTRDETRKQVLAVKEARRILVGRYLGFLFENRDTVRYQVQEMMRTERIVRDKDIQHELATYNELLGGPGELGCTLLIGIPTEAERNVKLEKWVGLLDTLYAELPDGSRVKPTWDERQIGRGRLSAVQYLKFDTSGQTPVALGCSFDDPEVNVRAALTDAQRQALSADLAD